MKKWICALLAMCLLAVLPACAEGELPVLTAQLGKAAELAEQTELIKLLKHEIELLSEKLSLSNTRQFSPSTEAD